MPRRRSRARTPLQIAARRPEIPVRANAHDGVGEQAARVQAAAQDGAHRLADQVVDGIVRLGHRALPVGHRGEHQAADGGRCPPRQGFDAQILRVLGQPSGQDLQRVRLPEADRQARGIGGQAEDVHACRRRQLRIDLREGRPLATPSSTWRTFSASLESSAGGFSRSASSSSAVSACSNPPPRPRTPRWHRRSGCAGGCARHGGAGN